jgi:hypothetical protein
LKVRSLKIKLAADIDVCGPRTHRPAGNKAALHEKVRVVAHDLSVLARARLTFVRIDY